MTEHTADQDAATPRTEREIFAHLGEDAYRDHVAASVRVAYALAGNPDIDDPRTIIDRLAAGETADDLVAEMLRET